MFQVSRPVGSSTMASVTGELGWNAKSPAKSSPYLTAKAREADQSPSFTARDISDLPPARGPREPSGAGSPGEASPGEAPPAAAAAAAAGAGAGSPSCLPSAQMR